MKNFLIVSDKLMLGGLETNIISTVKALVKLGHNVYIFAREYSLSFKQSLKEVSNVTLLDSDLSFDGWGTTTDLIDAVSELEEVIERFNIDVVHAHPFNSIVIALFAAKRKGVEIWVTLHGPVSLTLSNSYYNLLKVLGGLFDRCFAVSEEVLYLARPFFTNIELVRNSVFIDEYERLEKPRELIKKVIVVSRLDEDKVSGISHLLSLLKHTEILIDIAGEGNNQECLESFVVDNGLQERVRFLGHLREVTSIFHQYDFVAGMGRVVVEAMVGGLPVCLVGYDGVKGFVSDDNLSVFQKTNFSGRGVLNKEEISIGESFPIVSQSKLKDFSSSEQWKNLLECRQRRWFLPFFKKEKSFINDFFECLKYKIGYVEQGDTPYLLDNVFWDTLEDWLVSLKSDSVEKLLWVIYNYKKGNAN